MISFHLFIPYLVTWWLLGGFYEDRESYTKEIILCIELCVLPFQNLILLAVLLLSANVPSYMGGCLRREGGRTGDRSRKGAGPHLLLSVDLFKKVF